MSAGIRLAVSAGIRLNHPHVCVLIGIGNVGGVAVSGLEMAQNSMRYGWTREEVDQRLQMIMTDIHRSCVEIGERFGTPGNYVNGANIAGFLKVADAMLDQGVV